MSSVSVEMLINALGLDIKDSDLQGQLDAIKAGKTSEIPDASDDSQTVSVPRNYLLSVAEMTKAFEVTLDCYDRSATSPVVVFANQFARMGNSLVSAQTQKYLASK